eukprot:scaffold37716_cov63-Phaeocystis_antarctica.AAC.8
MNRRVNSEMFAPNPIDTRNSKFAGPGAMRTDGPSNASLSGFLAWAPRSRLLQAAPYASSGPHPSPAASPATVEEPRARKGAVRKVRKVVQTSGAHVVPGRPVTGISRRFPPTELSGERYSVLSVF